MDHYRYRLVQGGMVVASVAAPTDKAARREIDHYALMYVSEGDVMVQRRRGKRYETVYITAMKKEASSERRAK